MDKWFKLEWPSAELGVGQIGGIKYNTYRSPYELPLAVGVETLRHGIVRFEFKYADGSESERKFKVDEDVTLFLGRHTMRLLAIELHLQKLIERAAAERSLQRAWDLIAQRKANEVSNFGGVRPLFEQRKDALLTALVS